MSGTLYRAFDADGELLYVGATMKGAQRIEEHGDKEWWSLVATFSVEHFVTKEETFGAEAVAIASEEPLYNRAAPRLAAVDAPNRIGELRRARRMEQYDVASALRVHPSTVYRWETGSTIPDSQKAKLAELFDVSLPYLMYWDEAA